MSRKKAKQHYCGIGGQAVLDGIMMRNGKDYAIAVRRTDGTIAVEKKVGKKKEKSVLSGIPFVRGVVNFIDSLRTGFESLNFSAEIGMEDIEEEPGRFELFLKKHFGDKANDIIMSLTVFAAVILAVAVFILLPYGLSAFAGQFIVSSLVLSIFEGVLRLLIFIGYVTLIGLMDDIDRMYMYHGAEHKCINCIERGKPLTVRNVRRSSRLHPRCGTSFMLYVMVLSCVCFFFIQASNPFLKLLYRLLLIPVIAAVSYELIQLAGRSSNPIVKLLNLPGMGMQMLSTREPDDEMIEVAIEAVEAVFDWEGYQEVIFGSVGEDDDEPQQVETEYEPIEEPAAYEVEEAEEEYEPEETPAAEYETEEEAEEVHAAEYETEEEAEEVHAAEYEPIEETAAYEAEEEEEGYESEETPTVEYEAEEEDDEILRENAEIEAFLDQLIAEEMNREEKKKEKKTGRGNEQKTSEQNNTEQNAAETVRSEEEAGREIEELLEHDL